MEFFQSEDRSVDAPRTLGFQVAMELTDFEVDVVSGAKGIHLASWSDAKCGSGHCTV